MGELEKRRLIRVPTESGPAESEPDLSQLERYRLEFTLSHIPPDAKTALEVGFGDFRMTNRLSALLPTTALDLPRRVASAPDADGLVFGSITDLPFAKGRFDLVVCCEVLEHLPDPVFQRAAQELQRVAHRYLLITVPYRQRVWNEEYKCPSCGIIGHYSNHRRTLDESLSDFFPAWKATIRKFGVAKGYAPDFMYRLARSVGNVWSDSPWGCHVCKAASTAQKPNLLGFLLQRILWRWQARAPRRPIWMLLLLERTTA